MLNIYVSDILIIGSVYKSIHTLDSKHSRREDSSRVSVAYNLNLNIKIDIFVEDKREDKDITSSDNLSSKLGAKMRVCGNRHLRTLQPGFIQASFHLKAKFIIDDSTKGFNVSPAAHCFDWQMQIPDQSQR